MINILVEGHIKCKAFQFESVLSKTFSYLTLINPGR